MTRGHHGYTSQVKHRVVFYCNSITVHIVNPVKKSTQSQFTTGTCNELAGNITCSKCSKELTSLFFNSTIKLTHTTFAGEERNAHVIGITLAEQRITYLIGK